MAKRASQPRQTGTTSPPPPPAPPAAPTAPPAAVEEESFLGTLMTWTAFVLTLALVIARALMSETVREPFEAGVGGEAAPRGPGAATTLVLDALCCLPALLVLGRRAIDRDYAIRGRWSHLLLGLLALWAALSVLWSTDQFTTAISAAGTIAAAALVWSTAQLVRSWLRLRIVAGVCLGLLLVYSANGLLYRFVQVPDNVRFWQDNKQRILQERQLDPDSFAARSLERKFTGGEMIGFNQSPNSFAAVIVLLLVISAGVAIARYRRGDPPAWTAAIALACAPALLVLYLTHSRTSAGTVLIAAAILAALALPRLRGWLTSHARLAYAVGAAAVVLGAGALIGHGVYHGSLPNDSLNFRWRYWVAASRLIAEHPVTGVGWGNFGPHYLSVRVPAAAEEVRDPHNFIVRGFAELGLPGGLLVIAWLARAAWELTRPIAPPDPSAPRDPRDPTDPRNPTGPTGPTGKPSPGSAGVGAGAGAGTGAGAGAGAGAMATLAAIAVGGIALNMACAIDFSQSSAFVQLEGFYRLLYLALLGGGLALAALRAGHSRPRGLDDAAAPWLLYAVVTAIAVFLVHALMDFVLAEPGALMLFAAVLGAALGVRTPSVAGAKKQRSAAVAALAVGAVAWVVLVLFVAIPVIDAEQAAQRAGDALRAGRPDVAAALLDGAFRTVPWNADYPARSARALMLAQAPPEKVKAMLDLAIATDPANVEYLQSRVGYELYQPTPDAAAVKADFQRILELDPNNITARLDFAQTLVTFSEPAGAVQQYREALRLNDLLDKTEPERLPADRVREIEQVVATLQPAAATRTSTGSTGTPTTAATSATAQPTGN